MEIEEEFMVINDGNGDDVGLKFPPGFSLFELLISRYLNQRDVIRSSLDKGKSKMVVPEKLPVKRTQSINVQNPSSLPTSPATPSVQHVTVQSPGTEVLAPTLVTKSVPLPS